MKRLITETMKQVEEQDRYTVWNIADLFFNPHDDNALNMYDIEPYLLDCLDDHGPKLLQDNINFILSTIKEC